MGTQSTWDLLIIKIILSVIVHNHISSLIIAAMAVFTFATKSLIELGVEFSSGIRSARMTLVMLRCWLTPLYVLINYSSRNQGPLMITLSLILIILVFAFFSRGLLSYFFFSRQFLSQPMPSFWGEATSQNE